MVRKHWDIDDWKFRCSELAFLVSDLEKDSKRLEWIIDNLEWASLHLVMLSSSQEDWRIEIDKAMGS
jgi:hypothetical protein